MCAIMTGRAIFLLPMSTRGSDGCSERGKELGMFCAESGAESQLGTSPHRRNVSRPHIFPPAGHYWAVSLYRRPTMCDRTLCPDHVPQLTGAQSLCVQTMCVQLR